MSFFSFFSKSNKESLEKGLHKTKEGLMSKLARAIAGKSAIDDEVLDRLEESLISADVSVETTLKIIDKYKKGLPKKSMLMHPNCTLF